MRHSFRLSAAIRRNFFHGN